MQKIIRRRDVDVVDPGLDPALHPWLSRIYSGRGIASSAELSLDPDQLAMDLWFSHFKHAPDELHYEEPDEDVFIRT